MAYLNGKITSETIIGTKYNDVILGNKGNDVLYGKEGSDYFFKVDNITFIEKFWGTEGTDTMYGGQGNDRYLVDNIGDKVVEYANEGIDDVYTPLKTYTLPENVENGWIIIAGDKNLYGNGLNNVLHGNCGWNYLSGGDGNDTIFGGGFGHDTLDGGNGNDYLFASTRVCQLYGGRGDDLIAGCYANDTLCGGSGSDRYSGFLKNETNDGVQFKVGFGNDIIRDFADFKSNAADTPGYDIANLGAFNLNQVSMKGLDVDRDGRIDSLFIKCGTYGSLQIEHYFDDSSRSISNLHAGNGCMEAIIFNQQVLHYNDIVNILT